ncbi:MAG: murein biosynthesis integral membrane protein MurJ [Spirochaetia bacterium]
MKEQSTRQSTISTFIVASSTFISRILGFLRTAVITALFGATGQADIINIVFAVPNNLRKLLAEGALSSAFIPVISQAVVEEGEDRKRSGTLARNIITFQLIVIIPICLVSLLLSRQLIENVLTQFEDPEQIELASSLFRFFINYLLFVGVSSVLIGVLNSHSRFFIPAITPILFSITVIFSLLLLHRSLGVYSMALGVLLGGAAQVLFQLPLFRKLGYSLVPHFGFSNPDFKRVMKHWLPVLATSSVFTINQQVAFLLASGLETGSASSLAYALVFFQLPFGIFSTSITTVLFPKMSRQFGRGDTEGLRHSVQYGVRFLLALLIPSAVILGTLGREIVSIAIQRGMFTAENTALTAFVLTGYCYGLFSVGAFNFLQRFFYSAKNYKLPFYIAFSVAAADIVLSIILKETPLRVAGLSIANSVSFTLGFAALFAASFRLLGGLSFRGILTTLWKTLVATIPVYAVLKVLQHLFGDYWSAGSSFRGLGLLLLQVAAAGFIYYVMYRLLKVEMMEQLIKKKGNNP